MPFPNTDRFAEAPLSASTSDVEWNKMRSQLYGVMQFIANNYQVRGAKGQLPYITDIFLGLTTETPCHGGDAYTDARYYLQRAVAPSSVADATYENDGTGKDDVKVKNDDSLAAAGVIPTCITATNLAELPPGYLDGSTLNNGQGSHILTEGTMVLVFGLRDAANLGKKWYVFYQLPRNEFVITGNSTRPGVYTANPLDSTGITSFASTGTSAVTLADIGDYGATTVLLINRYEMGKSPAEPVQHDLSVGQVFSGTYLCQDASDSTRAVFIIEGINFGNCS